MTQTPATKPEMTDEQVLDGLRINLGYFVRSGEKATADFAEQAEKYGLAYALSWAESSAETVHLAAFAAKVLHYGENTMSLKRALAAVLTEQTDRLLSDSIHSRSTSDFHNATAAAEARAAARFVRDFSFYTKEA